MTDATATTVAKDSQATGPSALETVRIALHTLIPDGEKGGTGWIDMGLLDTAERERAARFVFTRDRWSYTAAHSLLRAMLAQFHGLPPLAWRFRTQPHGRPEIDPACGIAPAPRFNITHTHGLAACALTVDAPPADLEFGVDAECLERSPDALALAERFCSAREAAWLGSLPPEARQGEFLRLWTLKEAVAKATGLGLHLDFRAFDCSVNPPHVRFAGPVPDTGPDWELHHWFVPPRHWLSLAVRRPPGIRIELTLRHLRGMPPSQPI
ncbi:4'-phosphopantetheinyl transferase [Methylomagnum ishizawai]|uniref:4'-phosphopantetheinyl transferase n=1 Tax=Methylomagnum ishizawai TaxID=1760988 RepID=A0A1Y6D3U0_9GAMM|nr:4'-phosphopantetheinyl transferase superfamily protein [Methylomagnum ishizawai]SMF97327.1 4'-phosphopantetheinyl transferase [Methylomagnum ishizawai]